MPRKFSFSSSDIIVANQWLEKKLSITTINAKESIFSSTQSLNTARSFFSAIDSYSNEALLLFCQEQLSTSAFIRLKGTLRAARKRQRALAVCGHKKRSIDLDFWAHTVLAGVAKSRGVTLSKLISDEFESEYLNNNSQLTSPK